MSVFQSSQKNFVNTNEVFPILDMIARERQKVLYKGSYDPNGETTFDKEPNVLNEKAYWKVESFSIERDEDNDIDPFLIKAVTITYLNGAEETLTLIRGAHPPVSDDIPDSHYINHVLLTEVFSELIFGEYVDHVTARIVREDGYGVLQRVELTHHDLHDDGHLFHDHYEFNEEEIET